MTLWQWAIAIAAAGLAVPFGWRLVERWRLYAAPEPAPGHGEGTIQVHVLARIAERREHERQDEETDFDFIRRVLETLPPLSGVKPLGAALPRVLPL